MIKAIIFDLDNTLVDFMVMKDRAIEGAALAMIDAGLKMSKKEAVEKIFDIYEEEGIEDQRVFDKFLTRELGMIDYRIHAAGIIGYRRAREAALVLYPHVQLVLMELMKRGIKLAVLSDAPRLQAWLRLCQLNLHNIFDIVITFEDTNKRKPAPEPFRLVLQKLQVEPEETIMVGDWAERDIYGAKLLKMRTVFARYGDRFGTENSGADYEVEDIIHLLDIVDELSRDEQ
ncbi:MAG: HAD-IIIA family hydrolase [candidate division WOR-3 bacterium]|nr:MAG: HAD-IIIA family hydrolase [candidate division WOR-3 bacterium]